MIEKKFSLEIETIKLGIGRFSVRLQKDKIYVYTQTNSSLNKKDLPYTFMGKSVFLIKDSKKL